MDGWPSGLLQSLLLPLGLGDWLGRYQRVPFGLVGLVLAQQRLASLHQLWRIGSVGWGAIPTLTNQIGIDLGGVLGHCWSQIVLGSLDDDLEVEHNMLVLGIGLLVGAC
jgi:hypothetical protein